MNQTILRALLLYVAIGLTACAAGAPSTPGPTAWTQESVAGLTIELIDPITVERIQFSAEGWAAVSIGRKNGPVAAPAYQWRLIQGWLQLYEEEKVFEELTLVSRDADTIVARRRNGQLAKYKILRK